MSSSSYALLTDEELAIWLPSSNANPTGQVPINKINDAAAIKLEDMCGGTAFVKRSFTGDHSGGLVGRRGGKKRLYLYRTPIVSVTSITDDDSNTIASTDYTIIGTLGNSYLEFDGVMPAPVGRWTIVYTAGIWTDTASVASEIKIAALNLVRRMRDNKGLSAQSSSLSGRAGSRSRTLSRANPIPTLEELGVPSKYIRRMV